MSQKKSRENTEGMQQEKYRGDAARKIIGNKSFLCC